MTTRKPFPAPEDARSLIDEADIGSGEKTPAQIDTEEMIRDIPPLPPSQADDGDEDTGTGQERARREHDASLERDEPSEQLDELDPVPPQGR